MNRITMLGTGYVGLVSGACLAELGHIITCTDIDAHKIRRLQLGQMPFYEPGLDTLVQRNHARGRLAFEADPARATAGAEAVFIAVGTPSGADGSADLSALFAACHLVIESAPTRPMLLVQKSTAPVGTARRLRHEIASRNGHGVLLEVAVNPEFLQEGCAIETFLHPDRVVIGTDSVRAERLMRRIYRPLSLQGTPMVATTLESAEMIKYASNCLLATKISYINEIANLCESVGADARVVAHGMGLDHRIGSSFLHPGPGFGGSCFPKDAQALLRFAAECGVTLRVVSAALEVNRAQAERMVVKSEAALGALPAPRIALLGLSFKPETDDIRESPGLRLAEIYLERGASVVAHDPMAMPNVRTTALGRRMRFAEAPYEAVHDADALVVATDWEQYRNLDLRRVASLLRHPVLLDLRRIFEPQDAVDAGLDYHCVGLPPRLGDRNHREPRTQAGLGARRTAVDRATPTHARADSVSRKSAP